MMMRLKLAFRNIIRHRLRSLLSVSMIAGAVCAIILFQGFSNYSLEALKWIAANNQYGNMQIANEKFWNPGKEPRTDRIFHLSKLESLKDNFPQIESVSGRLSFFGLLSNGDHSVAGKVIGIDPKGEPHFKESMNIVSGNFYKDSGENEVVVGRLLAKQLNIAPGDNITILTNTIDGIMNAMDLTISGLFSAGIDEIDAQVVYAPLAITQEILDTDNVDISVLKFTKLEDAERLLPEINKYLEKEETKLFAKSWRDLAVLFRQVDKYYGVQNSLIEMILLALMFLGILNTVSMTVVERTGEIGTLRSLGESRKDIVTQFLIESIYISIIGIFCGVISSVLLIHLIETLNIITEMPGASTPFQIKIFFLWSSVFYSAFLAFLTTCVATVIPAMRASNLNIVDALRKNI